jgi:hypothetical protein
MGGWVGHISYNHTIKTITTIKQFILIFENISYNHTIHE